MFWRLKLTVREIGNQYTTRITGKDAKELKSPNPNPSKWPNELENPLKFYRQAILFVIPDLWTRPKSAHISEDKKCPKILL